MSQIAGQELSEVQGYKMRKILKEILNNIQKLITKNKDQYLVVYKTEEDKTKSYIISRPNLHESFGNKGEDRDNVGFRAYCYGRESIRSFRHDRIVSITKL
jgi:predicted DNA-binding transcriptional regulator YafY